MADYDWVFIAGGAPLGGFTASVFYHVGPAVDGLYLLPALAGEVVIGAVVEIMYRTIIRPRQTKWRPLYGRGYSMSPLSTYVRLQ